MVRACDYTQICSLDGRGQVQNDKSQNIIFAQLKKCRLLITVNAS